MLKLPIGRPALMGILNVTPDSFSENGLNFHKLAAIDAARKMIDDGADLIDVGGESTRPGSDPVSVEEEERRVAPVLEAVAGMGVPISIDTRKAPIARLALSLGASVVNDITAMGDPEMPALCAEAGCHVCLMHMKGQPKTMLDDPRYKDVVAEVKDFLLARATFAEEAGIERDKIWLDPGIGFGKKHPDNLLLLNRLDVFVETGYPILIGVSRKRFIGWIDRDAPVDQRLPGTLATQVLVQAMGAKIIRAHDVREARQAIDVTAAILKPSSFSRPLA